jgi:voltage-gated potassium channel
MILTTLGSQYWPRTPEGRVLGFLISLYAFAVFGYFTALLASFFVGHRSPEGRDPDNVVRKNKP